MGIFWKILFINPPEGQVVGSLIYRWDDDDAKISKSPSWINNKIAPIVPLSAPGRNSRNEEHIQTSTSD
jgi:hypothetical protein